MTTRPVRVAWPAAAAVLLSALAVVQAGAGSQVTRVTQIRAGDVVVTEHPQDVVVSVMLALAMAAPIALAGLWPVVAASLSGLATLVCVMSATTPTVGGLVAVACLYFVVGRSRPWWTVAVLVAPFFVWAVLPVTDLPGGRPVAGAVTLLLAAAGGLGAVLRVRESTTRRTALVVAAQESTLEYVARGERARIARELHDVVAHHVSLIALQADAARLTTPGLSPDATQKLVAIGDTARTALAEMRRLLGVLREDTLAGQDPVREPQPGLQQVQALLDEVREIGPGGARLIVTGHVGPLDPSIELTAYRIVQEALTNARRHAAGAAVDVELEYGADALVVRVRDNGPGPGHLLGGHGLAGMQERVAMAGGALEAGAGPFGGFVVHAVLPARVPVVSTIRVAVVDDQDVVRAAFGALLATQPDFTVVGSAADGAQAITVCAEQRPDVVLMDVRMPVMDGIEATRRIVAGAHPPRVLVLTTFDLDEHVYDALEAGASGFLLKDVTAERLFDAVRVIAAGDALLAPHITRRLVAEFAKLRSRPTTAAAPVQSLTPREHEVLLLVAEGLSNPEIAARLVVGEETVKTHVSRVLTKLGLRDRTQAVVLAYESGLVVPRAP